MIGLTSGSIVWLSAQGCRFNIKTQNMELRKVLKQRRSVLKHLNSWLKAALKRFNTVLTPRALYVIPVYMYFILTDYQTKVATDHGCP